MFPVGECDSCGSRERLARVDNMSDIWVCEDCIYAYRFTCGVCERKIHEDDVTTDGNFVKVCPECLAEDYTQCEHCGEHYHIDDSQVDDYGNSFCEPCKKEGEGSWDNELEAEKQDVLYERRIDMSL